MYKPSVFGCDIKVLLKRRASMQSQESQHPANGLGRLALETFWSFLALISVAGILIQSSNAETVIGWGDNRFGQNNLPQGLTNIVAIAAGGIHSLALSSDGTVVSWGFNGSGQTNVPPGLSNVVAISAGYNFSAAIKSDGTVVGWNWLGSIPFFTPPGLSNVKALACGSSHCLALKEDGTVEGWGDTNYDRVRQAATVP